MDRDGSVFRKSWAMGKKEAEVGQTPNAATPDLQQQGRGGREPKKYSRMVVKGASVGARQV